MTFDQIYTTSGDSVKELCKEIEENGEIAQLLCHSYDILYNSKGILSFSHYWEYYSFSTTYHEYFTFDLKTGKNLNLDSVIEKEKQLLVYKEIKIKIDKIISEELKFNKDYPEFKELLNEYKKEYKTNYMYSFIFSTENDTEGIKFQFSYNYPWGSKGYEPGFDLFFSFEELKPYLTEEFKNRIFGKDLE